jgi:hypothetical protein
MSLVFSGPGGSTERRWIVYALLRDNVQHHLEGGEPGSSFPAIHAVSSALGGGKAQVSASELKDELERARALDDRPIDDLALSPRTVAVISHRWPPPKDGSTRLASEWGIRVPAAQGAKTLGEVFGNLIEDLLRVTGDGDGAEVEVIDN